MKTPLFNHPVKSLAIVLAFLVNFSKAADTNIERVAAVTNLPG
jgi:hypothetical protein